MGNQRALLAVIFIDKEPRQAVAPVVCNLDCETLPSVLDVPVAHLAGEGRVAHEIDAQVARGLVQYELIDFFVLISVDGQVILHRIPKDIAGILVCKGNGEIRDPGLALDLGHGDLLPAPLLRNAVGGPGLVILGGGGPHEGEQQGCRNHPSFHSVQ